MIGSLGFIIQQVGMENGEPYLAFSKFSLPNY